MTVNYEREQFLERPLPASHDSERVILGAVLLDEAIFPQAIEQLKPEHFYAPTHRRIYAAMITLFERRETIDPILIGDELRRDGALDSIGGVATITNLTFGLPHFSDISDYIKKIRDLHQVRSLIKACGEITSTALAEEELPEDVLTFAQAKINEVCTQEDKKGFASIGELSLASITKTVEIAQKGITHTGLLTGLRDLDDRTGGLQKTDLIIVAGRPGMGKSSLVANIAEGVCFNKPEAVVAVFSLEMSSEQYTDRILCSSAHIDLIRYRTGHLTTDEFQRVIEQQQILDNYRIKIDDSSSLTVLEARSKLMRLVVEQKRLDLVIFDYLQRLSSSKRSDSRQQEVSQIARELKSLAKDLEVPVIAVSSLSRACEARNPPKPMMSDLRESGDIESEADLVKLIYREDYYRESEENAGVAEVIIGKHRHGPTGTVKLAFMKEYTKFANYYDDYRS